MARELKPEYGYVIASIAGTAFATQYMGIAVAKARKRFGVEYPKMCMEGDSADAKTFNCTQRAHQNTLESAPSAMVCNAVLGLLHPVPAAVLMSVYTVGRIMYFKGYSTGVPSKRAPGFKISTLAYFASGIGMIAAGIAHAGLLRK